MEKSKITTLTSFIDQGTITHLIPVATLVFHKNQVVMVHAFNPRAREDYEIGGDRSLSQSHSEVLGGSG